MTKFTFSASDDNGLTLVAECDSKLGILRLTNPDNNKQGMYVDVQVRLPNSGNTRIAQVAFNLMTAISEGTIL